MLTGVHLRAALVVGPTALALLVLLYVGVRLPEILDPGVGVPVLVSFLLLGGAWATALLGLAGLRCHGRLRLSWCGLSLAAALWTVSRVGVALEWDPHLAWGWLRAGVFLGVAFALLISPGVQRGLREWGLLLLDGWLVGVSIFLVGWVALRLTGSRLVDGGRVTLPLCWIIVDLVVASVVAGLAVRSDRTRRTPVSLLLLGALLAVTGESTSALAGDTQFDEAQWLIMMYALAGATFSRHLDVWAIDRPGPAEPQHTRLAQVAVVPGLVSVVALPVADPIAAAAALSAIVALAVEMVLVHRQNQMLWSTLQGQSERLDRVVRESRDAIVQVGEGNMVEFVTDAMAEVLGRDPGSLLGAAGHELIHPDDLAAASRQIAGLVASEAQGVRVGARFLHGDGTWRHLELNVSRRSGGMTGYTLSARDVTERVRMETELRRLASTDALTGLLNRKAFISLLERNLGVGEAIVLFVDLDGFKAVNDTNGHAAGDRLLCEAADVLRAQLGPQDVAARLGGDEFALLTTDGDLGRACDVARRVVESLARSPSESAPRLSASVGIATGGGRTAEVLLGDADLAMYEAKAAGGGGYLVFEPGMRRRVLERARMSAALERACEGEGLMLLAQPIVSMHDGTWVGFEALTRWQDGRRCRLPAEFLPLAEETGLIVGLGAWVLRRSLDWLSARPDKDVGISVNVTGRQVAAPGFADLVREGLDASGVSPHRLTLEITEQTAVEDLGRAGTVLQPLRGLGVHVALDDFGTGFSSLGYLAQLPVDELKIDRRFVSGVGMRPEDDALVRAVIGLAEDLGLRVVAEGVETPEQVRALLSWGCSYAQGYRFRRPTPMDALCGAAVAPGRPAPRP